MIQHALTFDVEDWYHVENLRPVAPPERWPEFTARLERNMDQVFESLSTCGVKATFFVLGAAAERHPAVVKSIVDGGHELACHGWSHELVYRQSPEQFRAETRRAKELLEDLAGGPVAGYRASTFSITKRSLWALDILAEEGFRYDSSIAPLRHDRYGIPHSPRDPHLLDLADGKRLVEFPLSVVRFMGLSFPLGGGFFRLFSLSRTRKAIRRYESRDQSAMLYLHPWELDPEQPRLKGVGWLRRFRHYANLHTTRAKLESLLRTVRFAPAGDLLEDRLGPDPEPI